MTPTAPSSLRTTTLPLNNGKAAIPALGFGTLIPDPAETQARRRPGRIASLPAADRAARLLQGEGHRPARLCPRRPRPAPRPADRSRHPLHRQANLADARASPPRLGHPARHRHPQHLQEPRPRPRELQRRRNPRRRRRRNQPHPHPHPPQLRRRNRRPRLHRAGRLRATFGGPGYQTR
jgi:hypothetical protein